MNNHSINCRFLTTKKEWIDAYPVMHQLRTTLDLRTYLALVEEAVCKQNYQMVALYSDTTISALCGFMPMITLYNGKYIWVSDLVTHTNFRSMGYGTILLKFVHKWALENNFSTISLSSGLQRKDAHRFYEDKMDYDKVSYVYLKKLL